MVSDSFHIQSEKSNQRLELSDAELCRSFVTTWLPAWDRASGIFTDLPGTARVGADRFEIPGLVKDSATATLYWQTGDRAPVGSARTKAAGGSHFCGFIAKGSALDAVGSNSL